MAANITGYFPAIAKSGFSARTYLFTSLAIFFSPWSGFAFFQRGIHLQLSLFFAVLAWLVDVPRLLTSHHLKSVLRLPNLTFLLLALIWSTLSLIKVDPTEFYGGRSGLEMGLRQFLGLGTGLSYYFLILVAAQTWSDIKNILRIYVLGFIPPLIFAFLELLNQVANRSLEPILSFFQSKNASYNFSYLYGTGIPRITLLTPEATFGAAYAQTLFGILLAGWLLNAYSGISKPLISKTMGILAIVVSILTFAKALIFPIFFIATGLLMIRNAKLSLSPRLHFIRIFLPIVGLVSVLGILVVLGVRLMHLSEKASIDDISTWTRFYDLVVGLRMFGENPVLGVGWGGFGVQYENYQISWLKTVGNIELLNHLTDTGEVGFLSPYNLFVHFAAETGFVGLLLYCLFFFKGFRTILDLEKTNAMLSLACAFGFLATVGGCLSYVNFNIYYFWLFCALTHKCIDLSKTENMKV